jgi:hypothetical protein
LPLTSILSNTCGVGREHRIARLRPGTYRPDRPDSHCFIVACHYHTVCKHVKECGRVALPTQQHLTHIKLETKLADGPRPLLLTGAWRLATKLVAWERDQVKPILAVLVVPAPGNAPSTPYSTYWLCLRPGYTQASSLLHTKDTASNYEVVRHTQHQPGLAW